jgi:hypothetical protein
MSRIKRHLITGCVLAAALLAACGGKSVPSTPQLPSPDPGTVIQITGREHLGWTQPAATSTGDLHFAAYVDGNSRSELAAAACTASADGSYSCESPLPPLSSGRHSLELVAWVDANGEVLESARSSSLTLEVTGGTATAGLAVAGASSRGAAEAPPATPRQPFGCGLVSASARDVLGWNAAGTLRIADVWSGRSSTLSWKTADDEGWEIIGAAADREFPETGRIYVAQVSMGDDIVLRVVRYRLAGDILGERALIFQHRLTRRPARARLMPGPGNRLSIGLMAGGADAAPHRFLIQLTKDGAIAADHASGSVFADAIATQPVEMTWLPDGASWVIERVRADTYGLLSLRNGTQEPAASFSTTSPPIALQAGPEGREPAAWIALANGRVLALAGSAAGWVVSADRPLLEPEEPIGDAVLVGDREMAVCGPPPDAGDASAPPYRIWRVTLRD